MTRVGMELVGFKASETLPIMKVQCTTSFGTFTAERFQDVSYRVACASDGFQCSHDTKVSIMSLALTSKKAKLGTASKCRENC